MPKVTVNPPKTPITKGSNGVAAAVTPNMCKMPGPPAPFVPAPLPNIGKSGMSPDGYSTSVTIEGEAVAIQGATFKSMGDVASKGLGGGLLSMNTEGPTKFVAPGSPNVVIEGKAVQFLGDAMVNNCDPGGQTPNGGATTPGEVQAPGAPAVLEGIAKHCNDTVSPTKPDGSKKSCTKLGADKHKCCEDEIQKHRAANPENGDPPIQGEQGYKRPPLDSENNPVLNDDGSCPAPEPTGSPRPNLGAAFAAGGGAVKAAFAALKGNCYPDAGILNADGSTTFADFKFPCPPGHPSGKGISKGGASTSMSPVQQGSYNSLGIGSGNGPAITITP
jgi:uncharacterized Zn-binding protein involved in type VI secretion